jgi:hypothetical protein
MLREEFLGRVEPLDSVSGVLRRRWKVTVLFSLTWKETGMMTYRNPMYSSAVTLS